MIGFSSAYLRERIARPFYTEVYDPGLGGMRDARETRHVVQTNLGMLTQIGITAGAPEFPIEGRVGRCEGDARRGRWTLRAPQSGSRVAEQAVAGRPLATLARAARAARPRIDCDLGPGEESLAQDVVSSLQGRQARAADVHRRSRRDHPGARHDCGDTGPPRLPRPSARRSSASRAHAPSRNGPWAAEIAVTRDTICQCHHRRSCRMPRMCLLDIETDEVVRAVERRLAAGASRV